MSEYNPDKWVIVKFNDNDKSWYRVLGSWSGGYTDGDSWRMSSGIDNIEENGDFYLVMNASGSTYKCHKDAEGMHILSTSILETAKKHGSENGVTVTTITVPEFMDK